MWLPTLDEITLQSLSGDVLFDSVRATSPSAGGLMVRTGMTSVLFRLVS